MKQVTQEFLDKAYKRLVTTLVVFVVHLMMFGGILALMLTISDSSMHIIGPTLVGVWFLSKIIYLAIKFRKLRKTLYYFSSSIQGMVRGYVTFISNSFCSLMVPFIDFGTLIEGINQIRKMKKANSLTLPTFK